MTTIPDSDGRILEDLRLPLFRARLTLRLVEDAMLPAYKGPMLRGGFGYAFQRASCPQRCWGRSHECTVANLCPYRWIFETPRPPDVAQLHDLRDVPRPFVITPPSDDRTRYEAGETLDFGLVLIGRSIEHLSYFLYGFEQFAKAGLGRSHARARLERVEALNRWDATGAVIYQDGRAPAETQQLPLIDSSDVRARAVRLPTDLRLTLRAPLRLKTHGEFMATLDVPTLIQALCWRLSALALFHGDAPWQVDYRRLVAVGREVQLEQAAFQWVDRVRTSTRGETPHTMPQGGIIGSAVLRGVPENLRALLLVGSLVHVGKACTFGNGGYRIEGIEAIR